MIRTFAIIAAGLAIAGSASAAEIKVSVVGKDAESVRADIRKAARTVCRMVYRNDYYGRVHELSSCVSQATANAMAQLSAPSESAVAATGASAVGAVASVAD